MPKIVIRGEKSGIIFSFRSKRQLALFHIIKEYYDENGEVEYAEILFEIKGRKCRKILKKWKENIKEF